ncbi:coproporphyrinogen III oxidase family protein [Sulfurospirillum sp. T05]|uniref:Coproporphyrinogen III oxidase family protein n=1 Tax=Sulfurospirillum tamanense TaxID=2813362 RepID=A0ABS2WQS3_9BACT|nr:coproporphyrinogen III oxidase family protein [Sulfurospirillum tamanensis]MBN2964031.1 coproporphyrinogen III oxidase family protein [Sulfurospirillum tamanensis]
MPLNFVQSSTVFWAEKIMRKSLANHLVITPVKEEIKRKAKPGHTYMLYIHIPFCHTFCSYCSFHKFYYNEEKALQYFSFVRHELRKVKEQGYDFETLYVGGGTTLINEPELIKTLEYAKSLFNIKEVSCESDPNHLAPNSLRRFRGLIDRLSIGVQSFDDTLLKRIGRYEKFGSGAQIQEKLLKMAGILPTTSIDLIFNFPGQTEEQLLRDVITAQALDIDQITTYPLMQSNLMKKSISKAFDGQKSDNEHRFYELIRGAMNQYRPVNGWAFSRQEEKLSDEYVGSHSEYVGVGSGSFSFLEGTLYVNAFDLDQYMDKVANEESAVIASCAFTPKQRVQYQFMTSLFDGMVDIAQFNQMLKTNVERVMGKEITMLKLAGAIEISDGVIVPTEFGSYVSLVLMREFYAGMDGVRAMFRSQPKVDKIVNL